MTCDLSGTQPIDPEFDIMAPGLAMDYRIWVEAGKEECFYQYVQPGAQFYVSFHVSLPDGTGGHISKPWHRRKTPPLGDVAIACQELFPKKVLF